MSTDPRLEGMEQAGIDPETVFSARRAHGKHSAHDEREREPNTGRFLGPKWPTPEQQADAGTRLQEALSTFTATFGQALEEAAAQVRMGNVLRAWARKDWAGANEALTQLTGSDRERLFDFARWLLTDPKVDPVAEHNTQATSAEQP